MAYSQPGLTPDQIRKLLNDSSPLFRMTGFGDFFANMVMRTNVLAIDSELPRLAAALDAETGLVLNDYLSSLAGQPSTRLKFNALLTKLDTDTAVGLNKPYASLAAADNFVLGRQWTALCERLQADRPPLTSEYIDFNVSIA